MKSKIGLAILTTVVLTGCTTAQNSAVINPEYQEWLQGTEASDYNDDGTIDFQDFLESKKIHGMHISDEDIYGYFDKYKLSLQGSSEKTSEADELMRYIKNPEANQNEKFKNLDKFFLLFIDKTSRSCKELYPIMRFLEADINNLEQFKLFTIYTDEATTDQVNQDETTFAKYFHVNHITFFEQSATDISNRPYFINHNGDEFDSIYGKKLEKLTDFTAFPTPTLYMMDLKSQDASANGIRDIIFDVEAKNNGTMVNDYADTLLDCWNNVGIFNNIQ